MKAKGLIDDLLSNAPGAEVIMLIKDNEQEDYISVSMRSTTNSVDVGKICSGNGWWRTCACRRLQTTRWTAFDKVISDILAKVRGYQAKG